MINIKLKIMKYLLFTSQISLITSISTLDNTNTLPSCSNHLRIFLFSAKTNRFCHSNASKIHKISAEHVILQYGLCANI